MKRLFIIQQCLFFVLLVIVFSRVNTVFVKKTYPVQEQNINLLIEPYNLCRQDGFFSLKKNSLDVVFIGGSEVHCNVNPNIIWHNYGITSYDYSSDQQDLGTSYYYLKRVFKTQSPKVVFIQVFSDGSDEVITSKAAHFAFDHMTLDPLKIEAVYARAKDYGVEMLLPMYIYHERWNELDESDFTYSRGRENPLNGSFIYMDTVPQVKPNLPEVLPQSELPERTKKWINDIVSICDDHNCRCIFYKSPIIQKIDFYSYLESLSDYCESIGVEFLNLGHSYEEVGLDLSKDYVDTAHMNYNGQYKMSMFLGKYLQENFDISDKRNDDTLQYWEDNYLFMMDYIENFK